MEQDSLLAHSVNSEMMEVPSILPSTPLPPPRSPIPPEVSLPPEATDSDISAILPSVDSIAAMTLPPETPSLGVEMPQIPPADVSSLLGTTDQQVLPVQPEDQSLQPSELPQMENMGYDQVRV